MLLIKQEQIKRRFLWRPFDNLTTILVSMRCGIFIYQQKVETSHFTFRYPEVTLKNYMENFHVRIENQEEYM